MQSVNFENIETRSEVEDILSQYIPEKSVIYFLAKNLYWKEDKILDWRFNLETLANKYSEFVSNAIKFGVFTGKTLFISGAKSDYILPQDEFAIKQQFPKAQFIKIKNAAHWVQADNPVDFSEAVRDFLNI